jgi:uncharacterized cupin superfamily protein
MVAEAPLHELESGLAALRDGWFVVDVRDAAWVRNDAFGARCPLEANRPVLRRRSDVPTHAFPQVGIHLQVLLPGQPSGLYHAESSQENFLVLSGKCLLLVEGEERPLKAWDFVHCPPGTAHCFVGAGEGPCAIVLIGARTGDRRIVYPVSDLALRHGAGVERETDSPHEAYAAFPSWEPDRPESWSGLPWA